MAGKKKPKSSASGRERGGFKASRHGTSRAKDAGPAEARRSSAAGPKSAQKKAAEDRERAGAAHTAGDASRFLRGGKIDPLRISGKETVADLIDGTFLAYNAARLREACQLFTKRMLDDDVTVGMTLTGALTPAGLGMAALIPLIEAGFVDWIISTGANLYHDTHFGLGLAMHRGNPQESDVVLREEGVVRIYDIFFDYDVLLSTDAFFRKIIPVARVPEADVERGIPLAVRQVRSAAREGARDRLEVAARRGLRMRRPHLHVVARAIRRSG